MKQCNGDDAAFPGTGFQQGGLTKREYFAAMAMQGLAASYTLGTPKRVPLIQCAIECADTLIEALNSDQPPVSGAQ